MIKISLLFFISFFSLNIVSSEKFFLGSPDLLGCPIGVYNICRLLRRRINPLHRLFLRESPGIELDRIEHEIEYLDFFHRQGVRFLPTDESIHTMIDHSNMHAEREFARDYDYSYIGILKKFIQMGCPLEIVNADQLTPLAHASMHGKTLFVQTLLEEGANPFAQLVESSSKENCHFISPEKGDENVGILKKCIEMGLPLEFVESPSKENCRSISPERKAECLRLITAAKRKAICSLNQNPELYFSILSNDVMKEVSNYVQ